MSLRNNTQLKASLIEAFRSHALIVGEKKKLASGLESDVYINSKFLSLDSQGLHLLSLALWEELMGLDENVQAVAGVSIGGDPLVAGVLLCAQKQDYPLGGVLIRKEPKKHGASEGSRIESSKLDKEKRIWMLEDVLSTGGSALSAARCLKSEGWNLCGVLALVDREMGALRLLGDELKIPVKALLNISEIHKA